MRRNTKAADAETALKKKDEKDNGISIYEYEQKYVKRQNARSAKFLLRFFTTIIGIFLFACLFFLCHDIWEMNEYAGYAAAVVSLAVYIVFYIIPVCKVMKSDYFMVNVNAYSAREAQKHNKKLRHEIADKMIGFTSEVNGAGWYDAQTVGSLAIALKTGDEEGVKRCLTQLYTGSVKKSANDLIWKSALKSAAFSAVSQAATTDVALVAFVNLQLVKDLTFLYGFRPSDAKLMKIFGRVISNSLTAYGLGNLKIGNTVARSMGDAVKGIPILGTAIATIVDSSVQGLTNGTLTAIIGYQTIQYLNEEYKLQNILDGIDVTETTEELAATCADLEKELKNKKKYPAAG